MPRGKESGVRPTGELSRCPGTKSLVLDPPEGIGGTKGQEV